jgi:hypothetical protein
VNDVSLKKLTNVSLAMMASGVIYLFVLFNIPLEGDGSDTLWLPLAAAAAGSAMASFVLPRLLKYPEDGGIEKALSAYATHVIIAMALAESVILLGFVGSFLSQEPLGMVPWLVLGEILMIIHFPREASFEATLNPQAQIEWAQRG